MVEIKISMVDKIQGQTWFMAWIKFTCHMIKMCLIVT